jgi:hypothetical protein
MGKGMPWNCEEAQKSSRYVTSDRSWLVLRSETNERRNPDKLRHLHQLEREVD